MRLAQVTEVADAAGTSWDAAGSVSIWVGPLSGTAWFERRTADQHYSASTMKLALVIAAFGEAEAGRLDLSGRVPVRNRFTSAVGGSYSIDEADDSDPMVWGRMGEMVALRWLAYRAIVRSSNLATNLLLEAVGLDPPAAVLRELDCHHSAFVRGIEDVAAREAGRHNLVTAADLARELQALAGGALLGDESGREVLDVLAAQQINDALPRRLPGGIRVAHKSGWVPGVSHDAGIVYPCGADPYVVVVCTTTSLGEQASLDLIADVSAAAYEDVEVAAR